jgi:small subunit ribosomal protein S6
MPLYESTFIARQDITQSDVDKLADDFSALIKENGGEVKKREYWGLRSLAYKINKNRKGHYVMLGLDASAAAVNEMERKLRLNEDVIRNLTIRVDEISKEPSLLLQNDSDS